MAKFWDNISKGMHDWYDVTYQGTKKPNLKALSGLAKSDQGFKVEAPTSYRRSHAEQNRDKLGRYSSGFQYSDTEIADSMDKDIGDGKKLHDVSSTAIESARYDPSDDSLNITYKGGDKEYKFKAGGPEGVKEWLNAPSKGRITQEWKETHRYPGY